MLRFSFFILLILQFQIVHADLYWQPIKKQSGHSHHGRGAKSFSLVDLDKQTPLSTQLIHSDLERSELDASSGTLQLKPTGKSNYHALFAIQNSDEIERSAIRYIYFNGKPVKTSPQDILNLHKASLQIVPAPLPREHWKYESRKSYRFIISLDGNPVADQPILASTAFGSDQILHTDASGVVELTIPEDFPEIIPESRATPPGELRLFTSIEVDGKRYETSLSAPYRVSPRNWKNASLGFLFIGFGGLAGFLLIGKIPAHQRRKKA